jgi:colanic acid/amylovoran biosynthesis glycosyltransferase
MVARGATRHAAGSREGALRICFRVGQYPALSETFVDQQIRGMIDRGHRISVLADAPSRDRGAALAGSAAGLSVHYIEPRTRLLAAARRRLPYRLIRRGSARAERRWCLGEDVVVCHFGWSGLKMAESLQPLPRTARCRLVVVFHGDDMSRMLVENGEDVYRPVFAEADLLLPVSRFWRDRLIELGAPPERAVVHHMGVALMEHPFRERPRPADGRPLQLISVGRLVEKKGMDVLLAALAHYRETRGALPFTVRIFGGGPLGDTLRAAATRLCLADAVRFEGPQPHEAIRRALDEADAFVLPSRRAADGDMEGIPVALMEAMASGLPVVTTRHSGIPELVEHEVNGLMAPENDAAALAGELERLVGDPEAALRRAVVARRTVTREFDNGVQNARLETLLTDLVAA